MQVSRETGDKSPGFPPRLFNHPKEPPYMVPRIGSFLHLGLGQQLLVDGGERFLHIHQQSARVLQGDQCVLGHPSLHSLVDGKNSSMD